jgi:hypothetical protein
LADIEARTIVLHAIWPLRRKPIVDADTATWHIENMGWLIREFGGRDSPTESTLVLPKPGFFTFEGEQGHALALRLFDQVRGYCGMSDWEVDLTADDNPLAASAPIGVAMIVPQKHAAGTFGIDGNRVQITYTTAQLQRPDRLIATFAHELAHYLLATATSSPPCDDDEIEFLTDLAAVYLGFGVFLANTRFEFEAIGDGSMQGWRWQNAGYLPEADLIFALALFLRAKEQDERPACEALKPHLSKMLRRAMSELPADIF